jgi:hypothetical protein
MIRSIEFDLVTRRERNHHVGSKRGRIIVAKSEAKQRATTLNTLRAYFGPYVPTAGKIAVTMTRIAARMLDPDGPPDALKNVQDGVADWVGLNDRDPTYAFAWRQESSTKERFGATYARVCRVRIEVEDTAPGEPRVFVLPELASAERKAKSDIKRRVNAAIKARKMR